MDNHSLDNKVKKYFEQKTIEPTNQAWDRLDAMLTTTEKPKQTRTIQYILAFAACLVSFLLMYVGEDSKPMDTIITPEKVEISNNEVMEPKIQHVETKISGIVHSKISSASHKTNGSKAVTPVLVSDTSSPSSVTPSLAQFENVVIIPESNLSSISSTTENIASEPLKTNINVQKSPLKIDADALLASVSHTKNNSSKEFVSTKPKGRRMDPNALLEEAENDVAKSFLVRTLTTLKETSGEIITSVSNRNQRKQ